MIKYIETKYIPYAEWWRVWPCETQQPALCKVLIPADYPRYKVVIKSTLIMGACLFFGGD